MYRLTRKAKETRGRKLEAMRRGKDRARMARPAPEYPPIPPDLRMRITVERFDVGAPVRHVFDLYGTSRIDTLEAHCDGKPWKRAGITGVLEGIRKACPRLPSARATW